MKKQKHSVQEMKHVAQQVSPLMEQIMRFMVSPERKILSLQDKFPEFSDEELGMAIGCLVILELIEPAKTHAKSIIN